MRKPWGVTALIAGLALLFSAGAMPAYADPGNNGNPGNNNPGQNNTNNPGAEGGAGNHGNNNPGQNNTNNPGTEGSSGTTSNGGTTGGAAGGTGGNGGTGSGGGGNGGSVGQTGNPPGANGTVKIHDWPEHKNSSDMANDPKVCQFEIHGFSFDGAQTGRWWIQEHKWGNGDPSKAVLSGSYTANGSGDWTSGPHRLDDGHYKLFVEMTHAAGNSGNTVTTYKMKVFKVECDEAPPTGQAGDQTRTETESVCEEDMRVTITRVYRNNVLQSETRTETAEVCGTTSGGDTRTESVCVEGYMVQRTYVNGSLANVTSTGAVCDSGSTSVTPNAVAGFESMPSGGLDHLQPGAAADSQSTVAGSQSAPAELAAIASLPSTSTAPDAPLGLIGLVLTTFGAALLRRTEKRN